MDAREVQGDKDSKDLDCAICYQRCVHPVKLPCEHIFCYLCAKGAVRRTKRCALCRTFVDMEYLENPHLLDDSHQAIMQNSRNTIQWFYQARGGGWWLYESRIASELEQRYQDDKEAVFDLQIAGFLYTIDLKYMEQYRKDDKTISRAMKRDLVSQVQVKGHTGIRIEERESLGTEGLEKETLPHSTDTDVPELVASLSLLRTTDSKEDDQDGGSD